MEIISWQNSETHMWNQKPGKGIRNESYGLLNPRSRGFARGKTDTVRRHRPPLPLLNPTRHSGVKASLSISDAHFVRNNWYWGQLTDTTHYVGPMFGLDSASNLGDFGLHSFFSGMSLRSQTGSMAALRNKALLELSGRKLDLATMLGEAKTTTEWFSKRVTTLARAAVALKKGRLKDFVDAVNDTPPRDRPRWVKDIARYKPPRNPPPAITVNSPFGGNAASRFLEYKYGLMPVIYDVIGGAQVLADYVLSLPERGYKQIKVRSKEDHAFTHAMYGRNGYNIYFTSDWDVFARWNGTIDFWYSVELASLKRAAEFGLITPSVAWELIPFSFVVDMVFSMGEFIEACSATIGCEFQTGYERERIVASSMMYNVRAVSDPSTNIVLKSPTGFYSVTGHERRRLETFPAPQLYVKNPMSPGNVATLIALTRQLL